MLSLPDKYKKGSRIPLSPFLNGTLTTAEKKRFKETVEGIQIVYQIEGFDIPNLINDDYNCQVIAFLEVKLTNLKNVAFVAKIIQKQVKTLCVIKLTDGKEECYSFADKRLNRQNKNEIIVEDVFITDSLPLNFSNSAKTLFSLYIDYETILNRNNKHSYYMEMMTKAFLVFNQELYSGTIGLLDSKLWYDDEKIDECYFAISSLRQLKLKAAKTTAVSERGEINKQIKTTIQQLEELK